MLYTITGATGNTGGRIARLLLQDGHKVRAVSRSRERLNPLVELGAEPVVADLADTAAITEVLVGSDAAYLLIPPDPASQDIRADQNRIIASLAAAVENSKVQALVGLSSVGAHRSERVGPVNGLYDFEQRFRLIDGLNALFLRPALFMENLLSQAFSIKTTGVMSSPANDMLLMPFIAAADIADYAARRLTALDFHGFNTRELLGQRDLTMREIAAAVGGAVGRPELQFQPVTYDLYSAALQKMGISASVADSYAQLQRAFNVGWCQPTEPRTDENTTCTSIEQFAREIFAPYFASLK